jgi:crotonobetainyl-CoA:carnitine CoA-transferase CaiB-like acyl-CoA transferase
MYPALCKVLGLEHLIEDARFKTNTDRVKNRGLIYPVIEKVMRTKTSEEWDKLFEAAGLPSGIMYTLDKVFQNPHVLERGMLEIVNHPTLGKLKMIGLPFKFESSETKKMTAPPMLGEHTDEILRTVADYDDDKIIRLKQNKIVS